MEAVQGILASLSVCVLIQYKMFIIILLVVRSFTFNLMVMLSQLICRLFHAFQPTLDPFFSSKTHTKRRLNVYLLLLVRRHCIHRAGVNFISMHTTPEFTFNDLLLALDGKNGNWGKASQKKVILNTRPNKVITVTGVNYYGIALHCYKHCTGLHRFKCMCTWKPAHFRGIWSLKRQKSLFFYQNAMVNDFRTKNGRKLILCLLLFLLPIFDEHESYLLSSPFDESLAYCEPSWRYLFLALIYIGFVHLVAR